MSKLTCDSCQKPKAKLTCGICNCNLCKNCVQFIDEAQFSFYKKIPPKLSHTSFCLNCYAQEILPEIEKYDALIEKAKQVNVFDKTQGKETRLIKRIENPVTVKDCADYEEALLRLAFFTAQMGYDSIIDVNLVPKKIIDGTYQTTVWSGSGVPVKLNSDKLIKDRSTWSNPN